VRLKCFVGQNGLGRRLKGGSCSAFDCARMLIYDGVHCTFRLSYSREEYGQKDRIRLEFCLFFFKILL